MSATHRLALLGAALWTLQPLYVVTELVVSRHTSADYSLAHSTISDLGNTACRTIRGDVLCSDWHAGMNVAFVWFGLALLLGALLLGLRALPGRAGRASVALWCVSGLGTIGVGLAPVNEDGALHSLVAVPIFVAQPLALLLMGISLRSRSTIVVAGLSFVGVIGFATLLLTDATSYVGAFERLALWPGYLWVAVIALAVSGPNAGRTTSGAARIPA
ncbi:DUF998 domain-containing protein [Aeromicrobium yanjiei]|uniref:DUF998 domain-containing protein n=1 Tax=Aeromicrobium yanjiei TaxID=2662028 RepID=A0A5Q2MNZ6_9ACTN|nr:DUF998 domain-containing protein [Aeromicrobium yanjiei]